MDPDPHPSVLGADEQPSTTTSNILQTPNLPQHISTPKGAQVAPGTTRPQQRRRRPGSQIDRSKYICVWKECDKGYGTLGNLNAHITKKNHGEKRTRQEIELAYNSLSSHPQPCSEDDSPEYMCEWNDCGKKFYTNQGLKIHVGMNRHRPKDIWSELEESESTFSNVRGQVGGSRHICEWDGCGKEFDTSHGLKTHVGRKRHGPKCIWSELEESGSELATSSSSAFIKDQPSLDDTTGAIEGKDLTPLIPEPPLFSTNPQQSNTGLAPPQHHNVDSRNQFNGFGTSALNYLSQLSANDLGASGDDAGQANSNYLNGPYRGLYDHPANCRPAFYGPIPTNSTPDAAPVAWVDSQVPEGAAFSYNQDTWAWQMPAADVEAGGSSNLASLGGPVWNDLDPASTPQLKHPTDSGIVGHQPQYWYPNNAPGMDDGHWQQHPTMPKPQTSYNEQQSMGFHQQVQQAGPSVAHLNPSDQELFRNPRIYIAQYESGGQSHRDSEQTSGFASAPTNYNPGF